MSRRNTPEDFWARVDQSGGPDACWPYLGRSHKGYGRFSFEGKEWRAHRLALWLSRGSLEEQANHTCDNTICCNPTHLYVGSQRDNVKDRDTRGRRRAPQGERHPAALLTAEQVAQIRSLYSGRNGEQSALARRFGVSVSTVHLIVRGGRWA